MIVIVEDAAQQLAAMDSASVDRLAAEQRGVLFNSLVRASHIVIMVDILKEHVPQMSGIQDKDQIQALFSDGPNPTFGKRIGIRALNFLVIIEQIQL
jgi:hypothetical protein